MTYTFTPEGAALATVPVGVTAYLAVKGERRAGACTTNDQWFPPADLAALVEQRCQTCDGCPPWIPFGPGAVQMACLTCHYGKPLHTIQYECHANHLIDSHEPLCDESGLIKVPGLWTYDALLPAFGPHMRRAEVRDFVSLRKGGPWLNQRNRPPVRITVEGTPEPGHFVLAVTRRTP